jgi:membrane protein YqaA with SNARE-associated domain
VSARETEIGLGAALISYAATVGPVVHALSAVILAVLATIASKLVTWSMDHWHADRIAARALRKEESRRRKISELQAQAPKGKL